MLAREEMRIYLLVWLLISCYHQINSFPNSKRKVTFSRNTQERERHPESNTKNNCTILNIVIEGDYCMVRIWHRNGTLVDGSVTSGSGEIELCHDINRCYYVEIHNFVADNFVHDDDDYYYDDGDYNECVVNAEANGENLEQVKVRSQELDLFQVGDCSLSLCGENVELFLTPAFMGHNLTYTHKIFTDEEKKLENYQATPYFDDQLSYSRSGSETLYPTSSLLTSLSYSSSFDYDDSSSFDYDDSFSLDYDDESVSLCLNTSQCNALTAPLNTIRYYLFDGETLKKGKNKWNPFLLLGNCCGDMETLALSSPREDGTKYVIETAGDEPKTVFVNSTIEIVCIDTSKCNVLASSHDLYYYWKGYHYESYAGKFFGECVTPDHKLLIIDAHGVGFNFTHVINDEIVKTKKIASGELAVLWMDTEKCNIISGTGNATYRVYHQRYYHEQYNVGKDAYSDGDHSIYYSFGKCACGFNSLFLSSSERGQNIMKLFSSTWGMDAFTNITSPQYLSACWIINYDPLQLNANDENIIQRYILVLLFYSTNGWKWDYNIGFLSGRHECEWNWHDFWRRLGIFCNDILHVTEIRLGYMNLKGHLISDLYNLKDLEILDLRNNQLSGSLPFGISQLKLMTLVIAGNNFRGSLPEDLFYIKSMRNISVAANEFSGSLPDSALFENLHTFIANDNNLSGKLPNWIGGATKLRHLNLGYNFLHGTIPQLIFNLSELYEVNFESNQLNGNLPSNIFMNENVKHIYLSYNNFTGTIPNKFAIYNALEKLNLDNNQINGSIPAELVNLWSLESLSLSNNNLKGYIDFDFSDSSLDRLAIENNDNLFGNITHCDQAWISADCDFPRNIKCECCQCFGYFKNPTAYEKEIPCPSSELVFFAGGIDTIGPFDIRNDAEEIVLKGTFVSGKKYQTCLSVTDCYEFHKRPFLNLYVTIGNNINAVNYYDDTFYFGYDGNQSLQLNMIQNTCASYEICNMVLKPGTHQRRMLNRLFHIYHTNDFMDTTSLHHKSLCWWLEEMQTNIISNHTQRYVLALLYVSTKGEGWNINTNWLSANHECVWYGIRCDEYQSIIQIDLSSNNLNGFIPTEIGELKAIEKLVLTSNNLTGPIPDELSKLEIMNKLDLSSNSLQGPIPSYIGFLKSLKQLDLSSNVLTNTLPLELFKLQDIESMNLSYNSFSGELPSQLSNVTKLEVFNISNNLIKGNTNAIKHLRKLRLLDLSWNYFTDNPPIFGSYHDNLEILHANGNGFSGSIPIVIKDMTNLKELYLHSNELVSTLPSEIGKLLNITRLTISYNKIKGTIPKEIGNLNQLELLHLHSNELVGTANHFDYFIESFTSDCGNTATTESLVECETCTECCNQEEECITETKTWPRHTLKNFNSSLKVSSATSVFVLTCLSWLSMIFVAMLLFLIKNILPQSSYVYDEDRFQKDSVYRFFLSSNKAGWIVASMTIIFQIWVTYTFFNAGDRTATTNEWVFSVHCPSDSIECEDTRQVNTTGWITFSIILALFTLPDIIDGFYLIYESSTSKIVDIKGVFFGVILTSVPMMCVVVSIVYLYATSVSNAALLKDSIAILFLSDIDEQVLNVVIRLTPTWVDGIEKDISSHANAPCPLNASLRTHEVVDHDGYNTAIDISDRQSTHEQNDSPHGLDSLNAEDNNLVSQIKILTKQIQEINKEREIERTLMFEMWNILRTQNISINNSKIATDTELESVDSKDESSNDGTESNDGSKKGKSTRNAATSELMPSSRHDKIRNFHSKMKAYYATSNHSYIS